MENKNKLGFWSILLFGINGIIGTGIFLLPGKAMNLMGPGSLLAYLFDMVLVMSLALCFAEVGGIFNKTGGPYIYVREAFGDFAGYEVGIMKYAVSVIAWATMAVGFSTALATIWPAAANKTVQNLVTIGLIAFMCVINILGVQQTKYLNNIITVAKLFPLILFIVVGIFFIKGGNFTPMFPAHMASSNFGSCALLVFYAFTGFESIGLVAGDMENPEKNVPKAIVTIMIAVSVIYILIQTVSIGTLGAKLATSTTPLADAASTFLGAVGTILVTAGTLISIGGINVGASFGTPRLAVALAEDGLLPGAMTKKSRFDTPYVAIIVTSLLTIPIALSGSFTQLATISVVSRFTQYIPTALAVLVLRKKNKKSTFRIPFGPVIPILAVGVSIWLLIHATAVQILWGLGALAVIAPFYFIIRRREKTAANQ